MPSHKTDNKPPVGQTRMQVDLFGNLYIDQPDNAHEQEQEQLPEEKPSGYAPDAVEQTLF